MENQYKGFDLFDIILEIRDTLRKGDTESVNNFIQGVLNQTFNLYTDQLSRQFSGYLTQLLGSMYSLPRQMPLLEELNNLLAETKQPHSDIDQSISSEQPSANEALPGPVPSEAYSTNNPLTSEVREEQLSTEVNAYGEDEEMQPPASIKKSIDLHTEFFDSHNLVIIKIKIPSGISEDDFRITMNSTSVVIHWQTGYMEQVIRLPSGIIPKQATAMVKNSILEIRIPKKEDGMKKEVHILKT